MRHYDASSFFLLILLVPVKLSDWSKLSPELLWNISATEVFSVGAIPCGCPIEVCYAFVGTHKGMPLR